MVEVDTPDSPTTPLEGEQTTVSTDLVEVETPESPTTLQEDEQATVSDEKKHLETPESPTTLQDDEQTTVSTDLVEVETPESSDPQKDEQTVVYDYNYEFCKKYQCDPGKSMKHCFNVKARKFHPDKNNGKSDEFKVLRGHYEKQSDKNLICQRITDQNSLPTKRSSPNRKRTSPPVSRSSPKRKRTSSTSIIINPDIEFVPHRKCKSDIMSTVYYPRQRGRLSTKSPSRRKRMSSKSPSRRKRISTRSPSRRKRISTRSPSRRKRISTRSPSRRKRISTRSPSRRNRTTSVISNDVCEKSMVLSKPNTCPQRKPSIRKSPCRR